MLSKIVDKESWTIVTICHSNSPTDVVLDLFLEVRSWMNANFKCRWALANLGQNNGIAFRVEDPKDALLLKMKYGC